MSHKLLFKILTVLCPSPSKRGGVRLRARGESTNGKAL